MVGTGDTVGKGAALPTSAIMDGDDDVAALATLDVTKTDGDAVGFDVACGVLVGFLLG